MSDKEKLVWLRSGGRCCEICWNQATDCDKCHKITRSLRNERQNQFGIALISVQRSGIEREHHRVYLASDGNMRWISG